MLSGEDCRLLQIWSPLGDVHSFADFIDKYYIFSGRIVPVAMERAIREIITPVVDRSVTIACMTTRELVMKV